MTVSADALQKVVDNFIQRDTERQPIEPVAAIATDLSVEEAYELQFLLLDRLVAAGENIIGRKGGFTTLEGQAAMGLPEPVYGHLFDSHLVTDGGTIDAAGLIRSVLECEIAFRLKEPLTGPGVTPDDVLAATESVSAALEIVDFRNAGKPTVSEVLGYNVFARNFVVGSTAVPVQGLDLIDLGVTLKKNGEVITTGSGKEVLGNPAASVAWLANKATSHDRPLQAGEVIIAGTMTTPQPFQAGDHFEAIFEHLGMVSVRFS